MDEQSLTYNLIENEFSFNFNGEVLHADQSELSKAIDDMNNNALESSNTAFPDLTSAWMNDFTTLGNSERLGPVGDECVITNDEFPSKNGSEDLSNGLGAYLNYWRDDPLNKLLENRSAFTGSQTTASNNEQLIGDDFVLTKSLGLDSKGRKIDSLKRKLTETSTSCDETDNFVTEFDEDVRIPVEKANFEIKKPRYSGLGVQTEEDKLCVETDQKRRTRKSSDTLVDVSDVGTTNLASTVSSKTKGMSLISVGGRRRSHTKTRNRRGVQTSMVEDSSSVPSPAAEVPSLSPVNPNEYIDDDELMALDTKELNMRVKYLPKKIVNEIKHRRRTLKNRGYARSCREKKIDETSTLQESNCDLEIELAGKELELKLAILQRDEWKRKYDCLVSDYRKHQSRSIVEQ